MRIREIKVGKNSFLLGNNHLKSMTYNKNDIINVATKLGRLVNGGVVGYCAGGKTSEVMRNSIPNELINVVERHKKVQLGANLAQSFIPGAGVVATSASVAMYYDINNVLGIKISENAGKSLTSAVMTNLTSAGAKAGALNGVYLKVDKIG